MKVKIIAFTGLPMNGKSTAREIMQKLLDEAGIPQAYLHFGSTEEVERRNSFDEWAEEHKNLSMMEKERLIREQWRNEHGMGAMAKMKLDEMKENLKANKLILIDNLRSDEERKIIMDEFGEDSLLMVALVADWPVRVRRGENRDYRPVGEQELKTRDSAEVYGLNMAPPIVFAKYTILNNFDEKTDPEGARKDLEHELKTRVLPDVLT